MTATYDLVLRGATVVNHDGRAVRDVGIRGGRIAALGVHGDAGAAVEVIDATGLHILPGVIDSQVHFREPGLEHKEDLETGSRAAVLGGVTAVFEMPNTKPLTVSAEAMADKVRRARHRMFCDFAFYAVGMALAKWVCRGNRYGKHTPSWPAHKPLGGQCFCSRARRHRAASIA